MLMQLALETQAKQLRRAMIDQGIPSETVDLVCDSAEGLDRVSNTFELLKTPKLIESYLMKNFSYVCPKKITLHGGVTYQYVPVAKTLQTIVGDKSFQKHQKSVRLPAESLLEDVEDGLVFQRNEYFQANPDAKK